MLAFMARKFEMEMRTLNREVPGYLVERALNVRARVSKMLFDD